MATTVSPTRFPASPAWCSELPDARKEAVVRQTLLGLGWNEALSSTFCSATEAVTFAPQPGLAVALGNPLNEEAGMLRPSLLPGMLSMLAHNLNRNVTDIQLFERGTVFSGNPERVEERLALSLGASGSVWSGPELPAHALDFYDVKGTIEEIIEKFAPRSFYFDTFAAGAGIVPPWLHSGRSARAVADGLTVAWFGQLHPAEAQQRKLRQSVYVGEIYLDRLYRLPLRQPIAPELSRFQPVERDFSFIFADPVRWQSIAEALHNLRIAELTHFAPREIFRAPACPPATTPFSSAPHFRHSSGPSAKKNCKVIHRQSSPRSSRSAAQQVTGACNAM